MIDLKYYIPLMDKLNVGTILCATDLYAILIIRLD